MNRFLSLCSWVCIAAVSYKYGYERATNEMVMDIVDWIASGDASKTIKAVANLAEDLDKDIPEEAAKAESNVDVKTLN